MTGEAKSDSSPGWERRRPPSDRSSVARHPVRSAVAIGRLMLTPATVCSALKVAVVVGTVLNLINNGDRIFGQDGIAGWSVAMNFVVPFLVSSYSAARNEARRPPGS
jgi:hypothetical protein